MAEISQRQDYSADAYVLKRYGGEAVHPGDLLVEYITFKMPGSGDYTFTAETHCKYITTIKYIEFVANQTVENQVPTIVPASDGASATINGTANDVITFKVVGYI